jgi:hypothetical protein
MNQVDIDPQAQTARIESGAKWGKVLEKAQEHGLAPLLGSSPTVGAVGYTLGGGLGWLARKYGLSSDSVLALEVVSADGRMLRSSQKENHELFWALRGGGGGFAIVTAMEIQLYPISMVYGGTLVYPPGLAKQVFERYRAWIKTTPEEMTTSIRIANFPPLEIVPEPMRGKSFILVSGCYCGPVENGESLIQDWLNWERPIDNSFQAMPFGEVASISNDPEDPMPAYHNGAWISSLDDEAIDTLIKFGLSIEGSSPLVITEVRHVEGAMARVDESLSAFGHRGAPFVLDIVGVTPNPEAHHFVNNYVKDFKQALSPHFAPGLYMNFLNSDEIIQHTKEAYPPATYEQLKRVKSKYDPENMLRSGFNIPPETI